MANELQASRLESAGRATDGDMPDGKLMDEAGKEAQDRWYPAISDPPSVSCIEARFLDALAIEYAAGWSFYDEKTRNRRGDEAVRLNIRVILRALERAGLKLSSDAST